MAVLSKHADRFTETDIDEEIIVMRLDNGEFFSLSGTGSAIWRLIDGTRDRATLIEALAQKYDADDREIAVDVEDFLAQLKEQGLLAD